MASAHPLVVFRPRPRVPEIKGHELGFRPGVNVPRLPRRSRVGAAVSYGAGIGPTSVAAGDWNGDGRLDLAVANYNSNDVSVLVNQGMGVFGAAQSVGADFAAHAVSGHPLLQSVAVQYARMAKFSPTKLSGQPVKVNGVIVYNFVAQ